MIILMPYNMHAIAYRKRTDTVSFMKSSVLQVQFKPSVT